MNYRLPVSFVLLFAGLFFLSMWLYHPATHAAAVEIAVEKGVSSSSTSSSSEASSSNEASSGSHATDAKSSTQSDTGLVQRTAASLTSTLSNTVQSVSGTAQKATSAVSGTVSTTTEAVAETVKTVDHTVKAVTETTGEAVTEVVDTTGTVLETVPVIVKETVNQAPIVSTPVTAPPVVTIPPVVTVPPISDPVAGETPVSESNPGHEQQQAGRDPHAGTAVTSPEVERPAGVDASSPISNTVPADKTVQSPTASIQQRVEQPVQPVGPHGVPFADDADVPVQAVSNMQQPAVDVSDVKPVATDTNINAETQASSNVAGLADSSSSVPAGQAQQMLQAVSEQLSDGDVGGQAPFASSGSPLAHGWSGDLIGVLATGSASSGGQLNWSGGNTGGTAPTAMLLDVGEASLWKQPVWMYSAKSQRGTSQWMNAPPGQPPQSAPYFNRH